MKPIKSHVRSFRPLSVLEAKLGLIESITLLYPQLEGIKLGDSFKCPLFCHQSNDSRKMKVGVDRRTRKPYWICAAGCRGRDRKRTLEFWQEALFTCAPEEAHAVYAHMAAVPYSNRRKALMRELPWHYRTKEDFADSLSDEEMMFFEWGWDLARIVSKNENMKAISK